MMWENCDIPRHPYKGFSGVESWCRIRIYCDDANSAVVVAQEVSDNPGSSITNMAEKLATDVIHEHDLDPARTLWVEHYLQRRGNAVEERFSIVEFRSHPSGVLSHPQWTPTTREAIEGMIGRPLPRDKSLSY